MRSIFVGIALSVALPISAQVAADVAKLQCARISGELAGKYVVCPVGQISAIDDAEAGISVKVAINSDGTVDTEYRSGNKPADPAASCSTFDCSSLGDAAGEIDEVSTSELNISATGSSETTDDIDLASVTVSTPTDMQWCWKINDGWVGYAENFTQFGGGFREGVTGDEYRALNMWPNIGRSRQKQIDSNATLSDEAGEVGFFLPIWQCIVYDLSETDILSFQSADGEDYFQVGSTIDKTLTFPLQRYIYGNAHEPGQQTLANVSEIAYSTTITVAGEEEPPPPPTGDDHLISTGTNSFNCNSNGVEPGDTVTFDGTSRSTPEFNNCFGSIDSNVATNGNFGSDSSWTKGTGWTISGGTASHSGGAGTLSQSITLTDGAWYQVSFDVSGIPDPPTGFFVPVIGGTAATPVYKNVDGSAVVMRPASTTDSVAFVASAGFSGSIDNVTVRKLNFIRIRNDSTESAQLNMNASGSGFKFRLTNSNYVMIDGLEKWSGAPAGTCGVTLNGGAAPTLNKAACGIRVNYGTGSPSHFIRFDGSVSNVVVQGVHIDGVGQTSGAGIGISVNDSTYTRAANPGEWYENILLWKNYIEDPNTEGTYVGPDFGDPGLYVRNFQQLFNVAENCGRECLGIKSGMEGLNQFAYNWTENAGIDKAQSPISIKGSYADVLYNWIIEGTNHCLAYTDSTPEGSGFGPFTGTVRGNLFHECINRGLNNPADVDLLVEYNTFVTTTGDCIRTDDSTTRHNICANTASGITGSAGASNNRIGTIAAQDFANAGSDDFNLTSSSPARNDGGSNCTGENDIEGLSRPQGAACDQGAYEFDE